MKNIHLKAILSLALSAVLFVSVLSPATFAETGPAEAGTDAAEIARPDRNRREDAAEPENAIGRDAAVAKALAEAGFTAEQAGDVIVHVTGTPDGALVYRVHFSVDGQRYSAEVDAVSGEVVCSADDFVYGQGSKRRGDGQGKQFGSGQGNRGKDQGMDRPNGGQPGGPRGGLRDGSCVTDDTAAADPAASRA